MPVEEVLGEESSVGNRIVRRDQVFNYHETKKEWMDYVEKFNRRVKYFYDFFESIAFVIFIFFFLFKHAAVVLA